MTAVFAAAGGMAAGDGYAQGVVAGAGGAPAEHGGVVIFGVGFNYVAIG